MADVKESSLVVKAGDTAFTLAARPGRTLLAVLAASARVFVSAPCGGRGTCGKCRVRARADAGQGGESPAPPISAADRRLLPAEDLRQGIRLACTLPSDAVSEVEILSAPDAAFGKAESPHISGRIDPIVRRVRPVGEPGLQDQRSLLTRVVEDRDADNAPALQPFIRLNDLRRLAGLRNRGDHEWAMSANLPDIIVTAEDPAEEPSVVVRIDSTGSPAERTSPSSDSPGGPAGTGKHGGPTRSGEHGGPARSGERAGPSTEKPLFGVAVDVGTTTVGCYLVDLSESPRSSRVRAARSAMNRQAVFGADVLSRISYADHGGLEELRHAVVEGLNELIVRLARGSKIEPESIAAFTLTGNTTMLHLLLGVDPHGIGQAPFIPVFTESLCFAAEEIGFHDWPCAIAWVLPSVAAYVGADIVSALVAEELDRADETVLMIDVGTNGELALVHDGRILVCSTAAGPAFEGATITHGVGGVAGAITTWTRRDTSFHFDTIADAPPVGICGSALLDAVAQLLEDGVVDETGKFRRPDELGEAVREAYGPRLRFPGEPTLELAPGITLSQGDVRELQLAKAAIAAGIDILLSRAGTGPDQLDRVVLTGGFGHHLNVESAMRTGLLPPVPHERISTTPNAAGAGAVKALLQRSALPRMRAVARRAEHIELSGLPEFQDRYIEHMVFPQGQHSYQASTPSEEE